MQRAPSAPQSTSYTDGGARPAPRVPGLLRFLPEKIIRYPHDAVVWINIRKDRGSRRSNKRRRKEEVPSVTKEVVSLSRLLINEAVTLIFLIDPYQPHSMRIRNQLVELSTAYEIPCIVTSSARVEETDDDHHIDSCLQGSGLCYTPLTASLQACFNLTQVPSLVVLYKGIKISKSHEELALEWTDMDAIVQAWKQGQSALSTCQQLQALLMFPMCVVS
jgi:hypothetical protein